MRGAPQVALLIEPSRGYGRALLRGIARYVQERTAWRVLIEESKIGDAPPPWLRRGDVDGIIARIESRAWGPLLAQQRLPAVDLRGGPRTPWPSRIRTSGPRSRASGPTRPRARASATCSAGSRCPAGRSSSASRAPWDCVRRFLETTGTRIFRRRLTAEEVARFEEVFTRTRAAGRPFEESAAALVQALLISPQFLFLMEGGPLTGTFALDSWALAARLRSPKAEALRVQIEAVKALLRTTELPLARVAERAGFRHPEYMATVFKQKVGVTPGQYRRGQVPAALTPAAAAPPGRGRP